MLRALTTAATGMIAQQLNIDVISNNMANVNTTAYKKVRPEFQDLLSQNLKTPGALTSQGTTQPVGIEVGLGTATAATQRIFTAGTLKASDGNSLDVAIEGDGFFQVQLEDGTTGYTRDGSFKMDSNGQLTTTDGYIVQPQITLPSNTSEISIAENGTISVKAANDTTFTEIGTLQLARFANQAGLLSKGNNIYVETPASGTPIQGIAGQEGFGSIQQGYLEGSNVQIVEEMINLIQAERAFEANSKLITASSDMLKQTNQLR